MPRSRTASALFAVALLAGCGNRSNEVRTAGAAAEAPAVRVATALLGARAFNSTIAVTGTLVSNSSVEVKAQTTGRVVRFDKEEGDQVSAGEPVIWVDEENYKLDVNQARAALDVAEANLERTKVMQSHSQAELERARNLVASGGITDKDLKAAQVAERDAVAQVRLASAQLDQAKAAIAVAGKRLRDTVIQAPVSGEIQRKHVRTGAYVEPPTPVFVLVDNQRLELEAFVPSAQLAEIRTGQAVTFSVNSFPGQRFQGRVVDTAPAVDSETRSAKVRIQVNNPGRKLKAGMFAEGEVLTGTASSAIIVPAGAVYRDDRSAKSSHVFVVVDGKAARRAVRIGRERDGELEITEGLTPGDRLITEQSIEIADGVRVGAEK